MEFNSCRPWFAHGIDPISFAQELWSDFEVFPFDSNGGLRSETDPVHFVYTNMTQHGCFEDILLRPRERFGESIMGTMCG
jgi:hypothetical protein